MAQKLPLFFCVLALASIPAFGENIPFSGSGGAGTVLGMPFIYDADGGVFLGDWSIGGVGAGGTPWTGSVTASDFVITFSLPFGSDIDPTLVSIGSAAGCQGGTFGGTTFCTTSGVPWTPDLTNNTLAFFAPAGNDLSPGQDFFVNIFFDGIDPYGSSFSGSFSTVPEPASMILLGTGLLGLACVRRRKVRP